MAALVKDSGRKTPARLASSAILACQSDDRLVKLVRSGHERAFEAIVQRYRSSLVRYCRRMLPESRCEDAVQQAFINAHAALLASDEAVQLKPWLFAITRNAALNMLRQNGWHYEEIPLDFDGVRRPDQIFEERAQLEQTVAALNDLPERQRDALVMREFEGRSYDEIALALDANDGAVRQLLNRARVALRSAAAAVIPPPLVVRAATALPPGDGRGAAEIVGGLGAAGIAKASATALVAGTLVVGVVEAPLPMGHKATREPATLSPAKRPAATKAAAARTSHSTPVALHGSAARGQRGTSQSSAHLGQGRQQSGSGHSGSSHSGRADDDDAGGTRHSGSGEREHSGAGHNRSDSDDSPRKESEGSGDRSGTSGGSGSDDDEVAAVVEPDEVSGGSDSPDSGPTTTRSGPGSWDSGSGSTLTSPTSGSGTSDAVSDGSASSGSGSSGSGSATSDDLVDD
jgi:RNA polymerase sigma factor (sigma-70 family)